VWALGRFGQRRYVGERRIGEHLQAQRTRTTRIARLNAAYPNLSHVSILPGCAIELTVLTCGMVVSFATQCSHKSALLPGRS